MAVKECVTTGQGQLVEGGSQDHSSNYSLNTDQFEIIWTRIAILWLFEHFMCYVYWVGWDFWVSGETLYNGKDQTFSDVACKFQNHSEKVEIYYILTSSLSLSHIFMVLVRFYQKRINCTS